jgi:hypothetical protein
LLTVPRVWDTDKTISMWIKNKSLGRLILSKYQNFSIRNCNFFIGTNPRNELVVSGNGTNTVMSKPLKNPGEWQHIAVTFKINGYVQIYNE